MNEQDFLNATNKMEYLKILESIDKDFMDSMTHDTPMYMFSAAIYESWSKGSEFEKKLANQLMQQWCTHLCEDLDYEYRQTKHNPSRPTYEEFALARIETQMSLYKGHPGLCAALELLLSETKT